MNNNNIFIYFFSNLIKIKNNFHIILYKSKIINFFIIPFDSKNNIREFEFKL